MADILETISNAGVKVEYDDPYSGSPFFSEKSLSAKIEKSPTLILHQGASRSPKDTLRSGSASTENSSQELQDVTSEEMGMVDSDSSERTKPEEGEACYENVSSAVAAINNTAVEVTENGQNGVSREVLALKADAGDQVEDLDGAIYDAPWDLGALQKGLEEKFKMNEQCSQDDLIPFEVNQRAQGRAAISSTNVGSSHVNMPPVSVNPGRNVPDLADRFPRQGSGKRQSLKSSKSPSRKSEMTPTHESVDSRHGSMLQKRPLPAFPSPQAVQVSFKSQNFPSGSLVSNDRHLFQVPFHRRGVPVMGGGSVGRGHQHKPSNQAPDWRPLEDYDAPWDNRQKDLMSTFSQEPSSLRGSTKSVVHLPGVHSSLAEKIESRLPLEHEWWYHGQITRQDAEKRLRSEREGSYLIRNSESNRLDYSLSIKSSSGCIHLKIVPNNEGRFILGQFSQPFASVAQMIQHYTVNKLPIKGAEHMSLTFPVGH